MKALEFSLPDQNGTIRSLADYKGQWLVLYFYPKDNTPGCTKEACNFRDARDQIASLGNSVVVGVSKDTPSSHLKFIEKHNLNFTLLSDESGDMITAYKSWGQKKFMGKTYQGILRNTFIISPAGEIVREYLGVNPVTHAAQIITDLQELQKA
ncbi:MAG: thioredoxin-dependent thiol peroxidase [Candidatus Saccharibacteria bacterium]|nr:thioredoxin-dependent thiol peroxidase [Candidatus Saccharibacteria bacterium]